MATLVLNKNIEEKLRAEALHNEHRQRDEVWNGVTVIMPDANTQHFGLANFFGIVFTLVFGVSRHQWGLGGNISDRVEGWIENYRIPDFMYFSPSNLAQNCGTHWCGGPDFLVEILSPGDQGRDKLEFYASVGVQEVLIIDREPWVLELYRRRRNRLVLVGTCQPNGAALESRVVPLSFQLVAGTTRPAMVFQQLPNGQAWTW